MLEKYLLNKDLKVTDKDIDLDSLKADLTKDYVSAKDVDKELMTLLRKELLN